MFCSMCGEEVLGGAGYCGKCGSATVETLGLVERQPGPPAPPVPAPPNPGPPVPPQPIPPKPLPVPLPQPVPAPRPKSRAVWWILVLLLMVGLAGWWGYSKREGSAGLWGLVKQDHSVVIANVPFTVTARNYSYWKFDVPADATDAVVDGTFSAAGGRDDMIFAYVMSDDGFTAFKNGQPADTVYNSKKVTQGTVHASLAPGAYYLVFDNQFSRDASKAVQVSVTLHYK